MPSFFHAASWLHRLPVVFALLLILLSFTIPAPLQADTTYIPICTTPLLQDWSNANLITTDHDWSGVPGIVGYRGRGLAQAGDNPAQILAPGTADDTPYVVANKTVIDGIGTVAEYEISDPTVAMKGGNSGPAPFLLFHIDTRGATAVHISYELRDLDQSNNNVQSQVALHYRIGETGNYANIPDAYVADATERGTVAKVTPVSVQLPAGALGQAQVQLRIMLALTEGGNEWVGVDNIAITCDHPVPDDAPTVTTSTPASGASDVSIDSSISLNFSEAVDVQSGTLICNGTPVNFSGLPVADVSSVTLTPALPLPYSAQCRLTLPASQVTDRDQTPTPLESDFQLAFTTEAAPIADAPTVTFQTAQGTLTESGSQQIIVELDRQTSDPMPAPGVFDIVVKTESTAIAGTDFTLSPQTVTFDAASLDGETQTITLTGIDDALLEGNETALLELVYVSGPVAPGQTTSASFTLTDNESAEVAFAASSSASPSEASAASTRIDVTLTINGTTGAPGALSPEVAIAVDAGMAASPGNAVRDADFTLPLTQITFAPGTASGTSQPLPVAIIDDSLIEGDETATFELSSVSGPQGQVSLGAHRTHTLTIRDDDRASVHFSPPASSTTSDESNANYPIPVTLTLSGTAADAPALTLPVIATVVFQGGSALPGSDFTLDDPPTVIFALDSSSGTTQNVTVSIIDDIFLEGTETAEFRLAVTSGPATVTVPDTYELTIADDDSATIAFAAPSSSAIETGEHSIPVALALPAGNTLPHPVSVDVILAGGTATSGADFILNTTQITFEAGSGSGSKDVRISVTSDARIEGNETITLGLQNVQDASGRVALGAQNTHVVTISDDDSMSLAFASATSTVNIDGADVSHDVVIRLSITGGGALESPLAFGVVDQVDGTATSGSDYVALVPNPQPFDFPIGSVDGAEIRMPITALAGASYNTSRTINLALSLPDHSPATLGSPATHTISLNFAAQQTPEPPPPDDNEPEPPGDPDEPENPGNEDGGNNEGEQGNSSGNTRFGAAQPISVETFLCDNLSQQSGGLMTGDGSGNTYCTVMALNGQFQRNPAEIGHAGVLELGVVQAVDVYGLLPGGTPVVSFESPARVCLVGTGTVLFLSAAEINPPPMTLPPLPDSPSGWQCVAVAQAGKVALVGSLPATTIFPQGGNGGAAEILNACRVTTTHQVRLRATPDTSSDSNIITTLPYNLTLTATERVSGWYRVIYMDGQGWVSADYLTTSGDC